jgi:predicted DNA-binding transcriptional regulator YafY
MWISKQQLCYLETKPLHRSQRIISRDDDGGIVEFDLIPNYELEHAILALGEHAKVLAPASLRDKIKERTRKSMNNYE